MIMKNSKKLLPVLALVLGLGLVFTQSAFTKGKVNTPVVYQYISNSSTEAAMKDIDNWQIVDSETPSCTSGEAKPCRFVYDGDFDSFLQGTTKSHLIENAQTLKQ